MKKSENSTSKYDLLLVAALGIIAWVLLSVRFDFYYDLNDDVMIKDIVAGVYTGIPDAHNNQMLYPISLIIAGLYRIAPVIPWFGITELACFYVSYVIIAMSIMRLAGAKWYRYIYLTLVSAIFAGCYLWELTMLQYTVVCGILATAATIRLYTTPEDRLTSVKSFIRYNIPTIILCVIAFNLRSEGFLLMCPFLAMAGIIKWSEENVLHYAIVPNRQPVPNQRPASPIFTRLNLTKYLGTVGIIVACLAISYVIDIAAYSGQDWQDFRRLFDARTQVYDFTGIPDYDDNIDFYQANGIDREEYDTLVSYNFAYDDRIDAATLETIADYVNSGQAVTNRSPRTLRENIWEYVHNAVDFTMESSGDLSQVTADDASQHVPMNMLIVMGYLALAIMWYFNHDRMAWIKLPVMLILRSIPWIYAYSTQRVITRITHPMYMIELMILLAVIAREINHSDRRTVGIPVVLGIMALATCLLCIPTELDTIQYKQNLRAENNEAIESWKSYAAEHPDTYYYMDVYSTVGYSERVFQTPVSKANWQLAGGWIYGSPLDTYKQTRVEYTSTEKIEDIEEYR